MGLIGSTRDALSSPRRRGSSEQHGCSQAGGLPSPRTRGSSDPPLSVSRRWTGVPAQAGVFRCR